MGVRAFFWPAQIVQSSVAWQFFADVASTSNRHAECRPCLGAARVIHANVLSLRKFSAGRDLDAGQMADRSEALLGRGGPGREL